jgi:hypothetical protein
MIIFSIFKILYGILEIRKIIYVTDAKFMATFFIRKKIAFGAILRDFQSICTNRESTQNNPF